MKRRTWLAGAILGAAACSKRPEFDYGEPKKRYQISGVVLRLRPEARVAVVQHEKIEGWMEAMTMEFPVPEPAEFAKLKEQTRFHATVCVNDLYYWLTGIIVERA
ncbi:MAG: copper-binding protein [Acidobacteria bacterium]|nr:copper-binding protein [Acidobacteriota bacterium]